MQGYRYTEIVLYGLYCRGEGTECPLSFQPIELVVVITHVCSVLRGKRRAAS